MIISFIEIVPKGLMVSVKVNSRSFYNMLKEANAKSRARAHIMHLVAICLHKNINVKSDDLDGSGAVGSAARLRATCTTSLEELEGLIDMDEVVPEEDELETFEDVADLDMHLE